MVVKVKAPGKLMLAGEWAVLEKGNPCIVMAVNKYVTAFAEEAPQITINAIDLGIEGIEAEFEGNELKIKKEISEEEKEKIVMAKNSVEIALRFLTAIGIKTKNFTLSTESEITSISLKNGSFAKVGFGSSAAAVIAIVSAILKLHGQDIESLPAKEKIYKLGCIAHYFGQGKVGSAFDVAASAYKGVIVYKRFDPDAVIKKIESGKTLKEIVESKWEGFEANPINLPEDFILCVGFVGYSASTKELVVKMRDFKANNKEEYEKIYYSIKKTVENLVKAIKQKNHQKILDNIRKNRGLLQQLSKKSGNDLETKELTKLIETAEKHGAAAKFSGAGAGDCGIAICFDTKTAQKIKKAWAEKNIYPIEVSIVKNTQKSL